MEQIINAHKDILGILGPYKNTGSAYRLIKYCVSLPLDEGILLFHVLTRELLLLSTEEYENRWESIYLREHWFMIPEDMEEKNLVELVRWVRKNTCKEPDYITGYTILTTTDCNARCFYCYEKGIHRLPMSIETADKVVAFIKECCGEKSVDISWFGGEPLINWPVIDRVSEGLLKEGICFQSKMISNGYLFDDHLVSKAKSNWNLKSVQITLDGTEEVYNRSKAFVYSNCNAYKVVTGNITRLLRAGIAVVIRLNMSLDNIDNLMLLADELAVRYAGERQLKVYSHMLLDTDKSWEDRYTEEELVLLYDMQHRLEDKLMAHGLWVQEKNGINRHLPMRQCMADNGRSVVIVPDGHIGLCEHYAESEFIGHIDSKERDKDKIAQWRKLKEEQPECVACFYYPQCNRLEKCDVQLRCVKGQRDTYLRNTKQAMKNEFLIWKKKYKETN